MLKQLISRYRQKARKKRAALFFKYLKPDETQKIVDLGSQDGAHIASIIPFRKNVFIADINETYLNKGKEKYGFTPVLIPESGKIPFPDKFFDIVFCSSVIEHVTVDKKDVTLFSSNENFASISFQHQKEFANEIMRIGKKYFVQTPYRYFPIESHTWLPFFIIFLPRTWLISVIQFFNTWWIKSTIPDFNLLTIKQMKFLFPDAVIVTERSWGFIKSIMAVK